MTPKEYAMEHDHTQDDDRVQCAWCEEWYDEGDDMGPSMNSDENTIPGTFGSGELVCWSCRDGAS